LKIYLPPKNIDDYSSYCDVEDLKNLAKPLKGLKICYINATPWGGGVAEMLRSEVPLMRSLGLDVDWQVIRGTSSFFKCTKNLHNALQGEDINITQRQRKIYRAVIEKNLAELDFDYDVFMIQDPQPMAIPYYGGTLNKKWIWRGHLQLANPHPKALRFIKRFLNRYNAAIFTADNFKLVKDSYVITPAIDPLITKNRILSRKACREIVRNLGVDITKPLLVQVTRLDKVKGIDDTIEIVRKIREELDMEYVLVGNTASDDPEGVSVFEELIKVKDITFFPFFEGDNSFFVNVFQTAADVVIQKSRKEGFGLVITEAAFKARPIIASRVGGIPLQIKNEFCFAESNGDAVNKIVELFTNPYRADELGRELQSFVKDKFLITNMLAEEMKVIRKVI